VADGKGSAAACVAIHLGEDHARDAQPLVEFIGRFHRVLPGHGVCHEQDFDRVELFLELAQLAHQLVVDVQPAAVSTSSTSRPLLALSRRAARASSIGCFSSPRPRKPAGPSRAQSP